MLMELYQALLKTFREDNKNRTKQKEVEGEGRTKQLPEDPNKDNVLLRGD